MVTYQNYTNGQIILYGDVCFQSWLLVPGQLLWKDWVQGCFYVCAILFLFVGIAIVADTFMLSIEMITSKKRIIYTYDRDKNERVEKEVFVWNETIANLTLMALGSSAPEILISVFETLATLSDTEPAESLGLYTIIGSAAYNMIVITAICVMSLPKNTSKRVNEFGVFIITSFWSIFAYLWLIFVIRWWTPNHIELWEAILTLLFFPALVISAWVQDKGCWLYKCRRSKLNKHITELHHIEHSVTSHSNDNGAITEVQIQSPVHIQHGTNSKRRKSTGIVSPNLNGISYNDIRLRKVTVDPSQSQINQKESQNHHQSPIASKAFARARFRHAVVLSMTGKTKQAVSYENNTTKKFREEQKSFHLKQKIDINENGNNHQKFVLKETASNLGTFCFSSASYSVTRTSKSLFINVLLNRRSKSKNIGFSHIVDAARRKSWYDIANGLKENDLHHNAQPIPNNSTQYSSHMAVGVRNSLPDVETDERSSVSPPFSPEHQRLSPPRAEKYSISRSLEDVSTNNSTIMNNNNNNIPSTLIINQNTALEGHRRPTECDLINLKNSSFVSYETREGNAKYQKDFVASAGTLVFKETEYKKTIEIQLTDRSKQERTTSSTSSDFYIVLKDPCHDSTLGDPSIAHVSIIDDNEPGEFLFQNATAHVQYRLCNVAMVTTTVVRIRGSDGPITVFYRTINGTAIGGDEIDLNKQTCDYEFVEKGMLHFENGETSKNIMIKTNPKADKSRTFIIALYHVTGSAKIGHRCAAVVSLSSENDEIVDQITSLTENEEESVLTRKQEFRKQIKESMTLDEDPSIIDMILHVLCFFWKVAFAFIPPRSVWGGWASFIVSLLLLGVLAALVEQFAKLLGCVIGLHVSVTGITLVALGTSMPDTFASKTAALQDDSADAAIGNITGSNSVNVFLGLGLPWVIKATYLYSKNQKLEIQGENLLFAVLVFLSCGFVTLLLLVLRRVFGGGELGGSPCSKFDHFHTLRFRCAPNEMK
ncbi:sodium/calcium exchanger 1-like isoform X2 [Clytia hemisphaerica]